MPAQISDLHTATHAGLLTLVHEAASVPPAAFVRYLPALQAVHAEAPLRENRPLGHCRHKSIHQDLEADKHSAGHDSLCNNHNEAHPTQLRSTVHKLG